MVIKYFFLFEILCICDGDVMCCKVRTFLLSSQDIHEDINCPAACSSRAAKFTVSQCSQFMHIRSACISHAAKGFGMRDSPMDV